MLDGYAIVKRFRSDPPSDYGVLTSIPWDVLLKMQRQEMAFDFETYGLDPQMGSLRSISLANDYGCVAIDLEALSQPDRKRLTEWLLGQNLIAHNMVFDGAWIYAKTKRMPKMHACTLGLFKQLSTEGFMGQRWGLKVAMTRVLGWKESNEEDLYAWLKSNKLTAARMAEAPWEILGKYNALDSAATWQLYKCFMELISDNSWGESLWHYHRNEFRTEIELLIEQQMAGMTIDLTALSEFDAKLEGDIEAKRQEFLNHPDVLPHVQEYQLLLAQEVRSNEPPQFTKTGKVAARYTRWEEKLREVSSRLDFNIDSPKQLQWLLFDKLGYDCPIKTDKGVKSVGKKALPHLGELGKMLKDYRELRDRRKFVTALRNVQRDGVFYPAVKPAATVTGRCGGGVEG